MDTLSQTRLRELVRAALAEDVRSGDVTTLATIPAASRSYARVVARQPLVVAGLDFAVAAFREQDEHVHCSASVADRARIESETDLLIVEGPSRALLTAERVALNFLQRLSGIATRTAAFVDAVAGTGARILDTRKTTPGWRDLEKYAVTCGGGTNHRHALDDLILIKDNHLVALRNASPNPIAAAVAAARERHPHLKIEVEADLLSQVEQALGAGADIILLDNMNLDDLRAAVVRCRGRAVTEASGGISLANIRAVAETGVDFISVGSLTHSSPAVDIGLDFDP